MNNGGKKIIKLSKDEKKILQKILNKNILKFFIGKKKHYLVKII